jgi:RimJ/RimL family protein N-acetyltransferase
VGAPCVDWQAVDPHAGGTALSVPLYGLTVVTITLRALNDDDLNDLFRWESDRVAASMAAFTRPDPTDRAAFEAHYQRVRSDPENTTRAIDEDGALVGMIASFTLTVS